MDEYSADDMAEEVVNQLGIWEFPKVKKNFNPSQKSEKGINAQLTVYCRNVVERSQGLEAQGKRLKDHL